MATGRNRGDVNEADRHANDFRYVLNILGIDKSSRDYLEAQGITSMTRLIGTNKDYYEKIIEDSASSSSSRRGPYSNVGSFRRADLAQIEKFKEWYEHFTKPLDREPNWEREFSKDVWDAFVQGYAPPALEEKVSDAPDILSCLKTILHGFTIGESDLFPLTQHQRAALFDQKSLADYAFGPTEKKQDEKGLIWAKQKQDEQDERAIIKSLQDERATRTDVIEGTSVYEFSKNFGVKMGGNISVAPALAPAARAELLATTKTTEKIWSSFYQERHQIYKKYIQLPMPPEDETPGPEDPDARAPVPSPKRDDKEEAEKNELRKLLCKNAKERIDAIEDLQSAEALLNHFGHLYVQKAYIGGSQIDSSFSRKTRIESFKKFSGSVTGGCPAWPSCRGGGTYEQSRYESTSASNRTSKRLGGDPAEKDRERWARSFSTENRALIQCEFEPLYKLTRPGDKKAQKWLKLAHENFFEPVKNGEKYRISNEHYDNVWLAIEEDEDAPPIYSCLTIEDDEQERPSGDGEQDRAEEEHQVKARPKWRTAWKRVLCCIPRNYCSWFQSRPRPIPWKGGAKDAPEVKATVWNADEETQNMSAVLMYKGSYFGRYSNRLCGGCRHLRTSKKSYLRRSKNTWYLERVKPGENVFLIRTEKGGRVLGVDKQTRGEESTYEYTLIPRNEDNPQKYENALKWKFQNVKEPPEKSEKDHTEEPKEGHPGDNPGESSECEVAVDSLDPMFILTGE